MNTQRCTWPGSDPLMVAYHDTEWGTPCFDDRKLFEFMILDTFQAGLSWQIILRKREGMRAAFAGFDPVAVAAFTEADCARLMLDSGIIRNRLKIRSAVTNAQQFLRIQKEEGSVAQYLWGFVGGKPIVNHPSADSHIAATSPESDTMSIALKGRGFKFVGSTICYAFMQGAGMVNDHLVTCFRHAECQQSIK
jgi:DNA-3-methyladenine glycosylase I